jgi:hypothetical protein
MTCTAPRATCAADAPLIAMPRHRADQLADLRAEAEALRAERNALAAEAAAINADRDALRSVVEQGDAGHLVALVETLRHDLAEARGAGAAWRHLAAEARERSTPIDQAGYRLLVAPAAGRA